GLGFMSTKIYQDTLGYYSNTEHTALNETSNEIILPDGTSVFLNADSELKYPDQFSDNKRIVKLDGEAFFDVTRNEEMPFIIETKKAEIRVLGTSFNVNTKFTDKDVEVYVESGLVELTMKKGSQKKLLVDPGNVGIISKNEISKEKNTNQNVLAWKTKNIVFKEDKLETVLNTLNNIYHVDIQYTNNEILNYRLTTTFKNQNIESVMEVICATFNLKVDYHDDEIILVKN
ncbi:MAG: FecR family protein, partial [Bacteroidota bacterium]